MDYVYGTLSNSSGENPLNYKKLIESSSEVLIVATDAITGNVKYFDKNDMAQDNYDILKASSAIPFVCHPYSVEGTLYYDGALGDPVPIQKAFDCGCDRVVVVLTKPEQVLRTPEKDEKLAKRIQKKYSKAAKSLRLRARRYNEGVMAARKYEEEGRAIIISPDDTCGVDTLTRNKENMDNLYKKGYRDAGKIQDFIIR